MQSKNNIILIMLLSVLLANAVSIASDPQDSDPNRQAFLQDYARIEALDRALDLTGLEELAAELEKKWFPKNKEYYGHLMLRVCDILSSLDFNNDRQYELEKKYAVLALEKSGRLDENNKIPIEVELKLLMHVQSLFKFKEASKSEDWPYQRSETGKLYFRAWDRLERAIDPNWDPNDPTLVFPRPPAGVERWASGMSPEAIEDPNLRAEYKAALEEFRWKHKRHSEQRRLRRLKKEDLPILQKHLLRLYSGPLFDSKKLEIEALQQDLAKHIKDKEVRATILDGLKKRLLEESKPKPKEKPGGRCRLETRQPSK